MLQKRTAWSASTHKMPRSTCPLVYNQKRDDPRPILRNRAALRGKGGCKMPSECRLNECQVLDEELPLLGSHEGRDGDFSQFADRFALIAVARPIKSHVAFLL